MISDAVLSYSYCLQKLSKLLVKARNDSDLAAHIAALGEFAFHTPNQFEEKSDVIVKFLLKDLLYRDIEEQVSGIFCIANPF